MYKMLVFIIILRSPFSGKVYGNKIYHTEGEALEDWKEIDSRFRRYYKIIPAILEVANESKTIV